MKKLETLGAYYAVAIVGAVVGSILGTIVPNLGMLCEAGNIVTTCQYVWGDLLHLQPKALQIVTMISSASPIPTVITPGSGTLSFNDNYDPTYGIAQVSAHREREQIPMFVNRVPAATLTSSATI